MPLVHLHVIEGRRSPEQLREVADTVQDVMLEHVAAPARDRYQLITEHKAGQIIDQDTGLGFERTDDVLVVQVVQQGRDQEQKQALYHHLAEQLQRRTGLSPADLVVSVVQNSPEDWSFGGGVAQFVEGQL